MIETTVESIDLRSPPRITSETPVTEAAHALRRPTVSALPVLEDESVVGIVTESDLVALVAETDERPATRAIMSAPVTTISPTATIAEAAETMRTDGVKHLPVVDDGVYRGLLSARTLAPYLSRHRLEIEWRDEPLRLEASEGRELTAGD
ncbi:cyclic nucleotide-binding/CBS domain-containing protein [Natrinema versiforme]|uniref:CBS domain-containing protein n=1 Tax=Natrinema versiforme TaxID=88724 RepID=A0A4V1FZ22_9EURY|nr:CBS domain-containing protein [Natrinema versiforme]QCS41523.1 CBS domain-containing protein [Natrinema versiforme]